MKELPAILKAVREAEDIAQKDVAKILGITPSALAKFENGHCSMSPAKILQFARAIHIDPAFVETGMGRPFLLPGGQQGITKLLLAEGENAAPDDTLIMLATQGQGPLRIVFVIAPEGMLRYKVSRPGLFYAMVFRIDDTLLLFRRRKERLPIGDVGEYMAKIKTAAGRDTTPEFHVHKGSMQLFTTIRAWPPDIDLSEISLLKTAPSPDRALLNALIDTASPRARGTRLEADYDAARAILSTIQADELRKIAGSVVEDIAKVLKNRITKKD